MYGKVLYDANADFFTCEFPIRESNGSMHICGKTCRDLVRHITKHHKIPAREYKKLLGLDMNEPLISKQTTEKLQRAVIKYGTYQNLAKGKPYRIQKGQTSVQTYDRSEQTKAKLRVLKKRTYHKRVDLEFDLGYNKINKVKKI